MQEHYFGHRHNVIHAALHPSGSIIATADDGATPVIHVWEANTRVVLAILPGLWHGPELATMKFSADGTLLAVVTKVGAELPAS